jgi:hypothetical protein
MVDWPPPKSKTHHIASSSLAFPIFLGLTFDRGRFRVFDLHPIPPRLIADEQLGRTMPEFV